MAPYFSIILPIYNVASYLERCIQSVLEQDFRDYELILVDDGSTDQSPAICDAYCAKNSQIRVIHKENGGLASARNAGLQIARGEYIWWVDSDDYITPNALQCLYQASLQKHADLIKFNYIRIEKDAKEHRSMIAPGFYCGKNAMGELLGTALVQTSKFCLSACTYIYKRTFLQTNGLMFISERIVGSEDYLFNLKVLLTAECIQVLTEPLYVYELREGSLTQRYKQNLPERYIQLYSQLCDFYRQMGVLEIYERKICRFFVWHLLHGTCLPNEYGVTQDHSVKQGRENIRTFLKNPAVAYATERCACDDFGWKQRVQLWAMRCRFEPLFYWLYVIKPKK